MPRAVRSRECATGWFPPAPHAGGLRVPLTATAGVAAAAAGAVTGRSWGLSDSSSLMGR